MAEAIFVPPGTPVELEDHASPVPPEHAASPEVMRRYELLQLIGSIIVMHALALQLQAEARRHTPTFVGSEVGTGNTEKTKTFTIRKEAAQKPYLRDDSAQKLADLLRGVRTKRATNYHAFADRYASRAKDDSLFNRDIYHSLKPENDTELDDDTEWFDTEWHANQHGGQDNEGADIIDFSSRRTAKEPKPRFAIPEVYSGFSASDYSEAQRYITAAERDYIKEHGEAPTEARAIRDAIVLSRRGRGADDSPESSKLLSSRYGDIKAAKREAPSSSEAKAA
jgi:hypothetical protein